MLKNSTGLIIIVACLLAFSNSISYGESGSLLPKTADPGVIDRDSQMNIKPLLQPYNPNAKNENNIEENDKKNQEEKPAVRIDVKFKLDKIRFTGNTIFTPEELEGIGQNIIGKEITLIQLNNLADAITDYYHNYGYITSSAYIPPQKIENGQVEIAIIEGRVGTINVEGLKWSRLSYIKNNFLKANAVNEDQIFNINNFKSSMDELDKTDYLRGKAVIEKGSKPKTTDIFIKIKERLPFDYGVSWDNLGRDVVGVQRATISLADNNLSGFGDRLYANTSLLSGMFGLGTGYSIPLGPYGTRLQTDYSYSNIRLGGIYKDLAIKGHTHSLAATLFHPLYKRNNLSINSRISFDGRHSETIQDGSDRINHYEDRAIRVGLNAIKDDGFGRWLLDTEVSTGVPLLGASSKSCLGLESSKFVKINSSLYRIQSLPFKSLGIFRITGQYSPDTLLAPEQMELGGMYTVRGFKEGTLLGDIGYNLGLEARTPVPYLPKAVEIPYWPKKSYNLPLKDKVYFVTFYDHGLVHTIHKGERFSYHNFLQSIGVGLRINLTKFISANFDLGIPIGRQRTNDQNSVRFHFGISSDIF